ncbi:MAG: Ppx/GppA family phosphatase [Planctomycetes bacterium]|nr:Ppx/GppA family phosphatase [Planctomycetota bacterium]
MPTWAAIDLGTNTAKLVVARRDPGDADWAVLAHEVRTARIGEGIGAGKPLRPEAVARTLQVLADYAGISRLHGAVGIAAVATSAVRDASNGAEFAEFAAKSLGVPLRVIDGGLEARLGFRGACSCAAARAALRSAAGPVFLIDIGGGSAQGTLGDAAKILWHASADVGAVRLTERCVHSDPIPEEDIVALHFAAREKLRPMLRACPGRPSVVLGVGGTLTTLSAIEVAATKGTSPDWTEVEGHRLQRFDIGQMIEWLRKHTLEQRKRVPGLDSSRADIIVAGAVIADVFLTELGAGNVLVTTRGLRWGLLEALAAGEWE